jgi:hypothetical protein
MPFDLQQAKAAGYSDSEIADYLGKSIGFDVSGARESGYSDQDIMGELAKGSQQTAAQPSEPSPPSDEYSEFPMERARPTLQPIAPLARSAAGAAAPYAPTAGAVVGGILGAPAAAATGPGAPAVEAGAIGLGYLAGTQLQNRLERYAQGAPQGGLGQATQETVGEIPNAAFVGMSGPVIGKATEIGLEAAAKGLDVLSRRMYEAVLKIPPRSVPKFLRDKAVKVGLEGKFAPTEGGYEKLSEAIKDANNAIATTIERDPNKRLELQVILNRIEELKAKYKGVAGREQIVDKINALRDSWVKDYMKDGSFELTGKEAQEAKLAIHRVFHQRYGKPVVNYSQEEFQTNEAIAKGIRQELTRVYPELAELNAKDSAMLELQKQLAAAVNRTRNWDIVGLVDLIGGGVGSTVGAFRDDEGSVWKGAASGLMLTRILRSPHVMSRLAFALSKASKTIKGPTISLSRWGETETTGGDVGGATALAVPSIKKTPTTDELSIDIGNRIVSESEKKIPFIPKRTQSLEPVNPSEPVAPYSYGKENWKITQIKDVEKDSQTKWKAELSEEYKAVFNGLINDVETATAGSRIRIKDPNGPGETWTAEHSTFPTWMRDEGWNRNEVLTALKKAQSGETLGVRQANIVSKATEYLDRQEYDDFVGGLANEGITKNAITEAEKDAARSYAQEIAKDHADVIRKIREGKIDPEIAQNFYKFLKEFDLTIEDLLQAEKLNTITGGLK